MRAKSSSAKKPAEQVVKDIRRATRRHFSAEDKIRIVLDGLRGDASSLASCPRHDACRRHRRAVPQGRHCPEPVLRLVEGVHGMRRRRGSGGALRRRMASAGWRAIRPVPRPPMRSRICAAKLAP